MLPESIDMMDGMLPYDEHSNEMLMMDMGQVISIVWSKSTSLIDLFRVLEIKILDDVLLALTPELLEDVVFM